MKKIIVSLSVLLALCNLGLSQDVNFSQFYETPLLRNPALAGIFTGDIRVKASLRSQWAAITVPYKTQALSAEYKLPLNAGGDWLTLGMQVTNDIAGTIKLRKTAVLPVVSFNKSLSEVNDSYLSVAFMGGPVSTQFNPTELVTHQANDPALLNSSGYTYWDMGAGITYSSNYGDDIHYFVGASMYHINNPKLNYFADNTESSIMGRKIAINGGLTAQTSDNNKVQAFVDYLKQDGNEQFLGGLLYGVELNRTYREGKTLGVNFGTFFRWNDALIPTINFDLYDWNVGLSYDVNISRLNAYTKSQGAMELSVTYRGALNRRNLSNSVRCPGFGN
jgi:type IX secretion system PorP/SprF family membrane protein